MTLSAIYGRVAALRRAWYQGHPAARRRLSIPVISVGNLVVGGSGKTPIVAAIARLLLAAGERPAILTRGYARRNAADGIVVASDGRALLAGVEESGDEPQMLARALPAVPVLVSADRYLAGRLAEQRFGATVAILDDGFQHLQLERTVDLIVVSPDHLDDRVLPSGRLREPLAMARSADAVLVHVGPSTPHSEEAARIARVLDIATSFSVTTSYGEVRAIAGSPASVASGRIVAVAGIARPQRFFSALRDLGYDIARELTFRDHHWFTKADLAAIAVAARDARADLVVTTEKDAVRLGTRVPGVPEVPWAVLPMAVSIEPGAEFVAWLLSRLHAAGRPA